jgi:hypothetical protein
MEFAITLQYPNGRRYNTALTSAQVLVRGTKFEMHGRIWRVAGLVDSSRRPDEVRGKVDPAAESTRVLCVCVE